MRTFAMGEKARLADLTTAGAVRIELTVDGPGAAAGRLAAYCFAIGADGRIGDGSRTVGRARPACLDTAVALVAEDGPLSAFDVDLDAVARDVSRLVFAVALTPDAGPAETVGGCGGVVLRVVAGGEEAGVFAVPAVALGTERALVVAEIYRRDGWRFGAVGQGYAGGLAELAADHGGDAAAAETMAGAATGVAAVPGEEAVACGGAPAEAVLEAGPAEDAVPAEDAAAAEPVADSRVSPADHDAVPPAVAEPPAGADEEAGGRPRAVIPAQAGGEAETGAGALPAGPGETSRPAGAAPRTGPVPSAETEPLTGADGPEGDPAGAAVVTGTGAPVPGDAVPDETAPEPEPRAREGAPEAGSSGETAAAAPDAPAARTGHDAVAAPLGGDADDAPRAAPGGEADEAPAGPPAPAVPPAAAGGAADGPAADVPAAGTTAPAVESPSAGETAGDPVEDTAAGGGSPAPAQAPPEPGGAACAGPAAPHAGEDPAARPAAPAAPVVAPPRAPLTYEGHGDRVLRVTRPVEAGPVVAHIAGEGGGTLTIWALDADLEDAKLLVSAVGAYEGRALLDERGTLTERLRVESDGPWTITLHPPAGAPWLTGPVRGDGPEVLRWTGPRKVLAMTHHGEGNFIVRVYAEAPAPGEEHQLASLANAIGGYDGESVIPAGPCLVEVEAGGVWTLEPLDG